MSGDYKGKTHGVSYIKDEANKNKRVWRVRIGMGPLAWIQNNRSRSFMISSIWSAFACLRKITRCGGDGRDISLDC